MTDKKFLSTPELAERWGISAKTIESWRTTRFTPTRGPDYCRIGRRAMYDINIIEAYEQKHTKVTGR